MAKKLADKFRVNKANNKGYIMQNNVAIDSFPVITGKNRANTPNFNDVTFTTPVGNYEMLPAKSIYNYKGFNLNNPALAKHVKIHQTYPGEYKERTASYFNNDPRVRDLSYGCVNCDKKDIDKLYKYFPNGGMLEVVDSNGNKINTKKPTAKNLVGKTVSVVKPFVNPYVDLERFPESNFKDLPVDWSVNPVQPINLNQITNTQPVQQMVTDELSPNGEQAIVVPSTDFQKYNQQFRQGGTINNNTMRKIIIRETPENGMNSKRKIVIRNAPVEAKYGGQLPSYNLDNKFHSPNNGGGNPFVTSQTNPYQKMGRILPEAEDGGNINIEKQEVVLADFDQDGQQETLKAQAPPHTEGGMDVNVPNGGFVFSDTKALKIKDPTILEYFKLKPKRGGYTPAEIAKQYDLNKWKKIIDDPNADNVSKKSAQLMYDNYLSKLNKLAMIQEQMKAQLGMEHHDPNPQPQGQDFVQEEGNMAQGDEEMLQPEFALGGKWSTMDPMPKNVAQSKDAYFNYLNDPYVHHQGNPNLSYSPEAGSDYTPFNIPHSLTRGYFPQNKQQANTESYQQWLNQYGNMLVPDDKYGKRTYAAIPHIPEVVSKRSNQINNLVQPIQPGHPDANGEYPVTPIGTMDVNAPAYSEYNNTASKKEKGKSGLSKFIKGAFQKGDPNALANAINLAQLATVDKFKPYEAPPQAVIPGVQYVDPRRAIAAQQEQANAMYAAMNGTNNSKVARAMSLASQGEVGKEASNIISQYDNTNVGLYNQANQQAAAIQNELMAKQAARISNLNQGNFLAKKDYKREQGRLLSEYVDRRQKQHDNEVNRAWSNKTSPYFDIDANGMPQFKDAVAEAKFKQMFNGTGNANANNGSFEDQFNDLVNNYGYSKKEAHEALTNNGVIKQTVKQGKNTTTITQPRQYGGHIPMYEVGGFLPVAPVVMPQLNAFEQSMPNQLYNENLSKFIPSKKKEQAINNTGGDIALRTNNPGNILYNKTFAKNFGAVDSGIKQTDGTGHFAQFPDLETGLKAQEAQLFGDIDGYFKSKYYKATTPVDSALRKWSNNGYGAEIYPEIQGKTLGQLTQKERQQLIKKQIKRESGSTYKFLTQRGLFT